MEKTNKATNEELSNKLLLSCARAFAKELQRVDGATHLLASILDLDNDYIQLADYVVRGDIESAKDLAGLALTAAPIRSLKLMEFARVLESADYLAQQAKAH